MVEHDSFSANVMELEQTLVRQFRVLQNLIEVTHKEREAILNQQDSLMRLVEEKEVLLDQLGILEDDRRHLVQEISLGLQPGCDADSLKDLLPHLPKEHAMRIERLVEGITTLAGESRELNSANHALALVRLDWVKAAQWFLAGSVQPEVDYRPPGNAPALKDSGGWGIEVRA
ncbi:MAG TPA: flagellar protein FlgN [Anaerolinea thermolimosa]|uniref:Flagellar protein FlgN n=1 Tax=Anaerolinea thermolimosa TaxID=229919 RepID=A0A3D1JCQ9_9CHLR|nr:flagellar protein FlgN [Anaerolinea thermolimosa]GAP07900.1 FlgN protein [Anaerolinea thermolimosa]HCE16283.1 flagellar protein FlgN [Anaerolinea thermolimosa]